MNEPRHWTIYALFKSGHGIFYIGCTYNAVGRMYNHGLKHGSDILFLTIKRFDISHRLSALYFEAKMIRKFSELGEPIINNYHNPKFRG